MKVILVIFFYLCIGATVAGVLRWLYLTVDRRQYADYCSDNSTYCVIVGVLWPVITPFAFAMFIARYGLPECIKKRGKNE